MIFSILKMIYNLDYLSLGNGVGLLELFYTLLLFFLGMLLSLVLLFIINLIYHKIVSIAVMYKIKKGKKIMISSYKVGVYVMLSSLLTLFLLDMYVVRYI